MIRGRIVDRLVSNGVRSCLLPNTQKARPDPFPLSQILNLLLDLKTRLDLSYLFISHDLAVVEHVSDRVAVMYLGEIVETGAAREVLTAPLHPYTQALVSAIPGGGPEFQKERIVLAGDPPSPGDVPGGCRFHPRCPKAFERCRREPPRAHRPRPGREVACHLHE